MEGDIYIYNIIYNIVKCIPHLSIDIKLLQ